MKKTYKFVGGSYTTPDIEIHSVAAEQGFQVSMGSGLIEDATTEDWGTL